MGDPRTLRAERFELLGPDGTVRARLWCDGNADPELALLDARGRPRVRLHLAGDDVAWIGLEGTAGNRVHLAAEGDGGGLLAITDRGERPRMVAAVDPDGAARIWVADDPANRDRRDADAFLAQMGRRLMGRDLHRR